MEAGTLKVRIRDTSVNGALIRSHGRAFPHLVFVLSMIPPIMISLAPSKKRATSIMVPTAAAAIPTESVK